MYKRFVQILRIWLRLFAGPIAVWGIRTDGSSIEVDKRMETSVLGIFAGGDITTNPGKLKLLTVGFGEAPMAVNNAKA